MRAAFSRPTYDARYFFTASLQSDEAGADLSVAKGDEVMEIVRRLEEIPAIEDVAYATSFAQRRGPVEAEHIASPKGTLGFRAASYGVSPDYFSLYRLRVIAGRGFSAGDLDTAATAVIVNQAFATKVFGAGNALGRRVRFAERPPVGGDPATAREASRWYEIVGVVANEKENSVAPDLIIPQMYYAVSPQTLLRGEEAVLEARMRETALGPVVPRLRQVVEQVNPSLRLGFVRQQSNERRQEMIVMQLLALGLGLVLLAVFLLSAAGIYTLVSFTVTRRRKEIGIRSALGATQGQVLGAVLWPVARKIALGVAIGLGGAAVIDRLSGGDMLGGRAGWLLPAFGVAMSIVALLAAFGPARRGMRTQPTEALRG
jgi:hypothetical protein